MSTSYQSADLLWTVTVIKRDGRDLLRVEYARVQFPDGTCVPSHWTSGNTRCGIVRTAHGYLVADVKTPAEVEQYVPLRYLGRVDISKPLGLCLPYDLLRRVVVRPLVPRPGGRLARPGLDARLQPETFMSREDFNRVAVVDEECDPPVVVTRYARVEQAEWFLGYLAKHGGTVTRAKVERGGYGIDAPEVRS